MLAIRIGYGDMVSELMEIPMSASDFEAVKKILDEGKTGNQTVTVRSLVSPVQPLSEMITGLNYGDVPTGFRFEVWCSLYLCEYAERDIPSIS